MSTGPDHYREAARLVDYASQLRPDDDAGSVLAAAQVHATLALAAATAEPIAQAYNGSEDFTVAAAWSKAIS